MISPENMGRLPSSHCYYIDDHKKTLIDTPLNKNFTRHFVKRPVDNIINTHYHRDHVGCNHLFPAARTYAHPLDIPAMESAQTFCNYYGVNKNAPDNFGEVLLSVLDFHPIPVHEQIQEGDIIDLGKNKLEVIHTPGHTPGHCVFYIRERGILFSGDIDLTGFGPWYGNVNSDVDDFINSIKKIMALNPRIIFSGHKGMVADNIQDRLQKYLNRIYENESNILESLDTALTIEQLTDKKIIYRKWVEPVSFFHYWEKLSISTHLRRLLKTGKVELHDGYYSKTA